MRTLPVRRQSSRSSRRPRRPCRRRIRRRCARDRMDSRETPKSEPYESPPPISPSVTFAMTIAPAFFNFAVTNASRVGMLSLKTTDPSVVGMLGDVHLILQNHGDAVQRTDRPRLLVCGVERVGFRERLRIDRDHRVDLPDRSCRTLRCDRDTRGPARARQASGLVFGVHVFDGRLDDLERLWLRLNGGLARRDDRGGGGDARPTRPRVTDCFTETPLFTMSMGIFESTRAASRRAASDGRSRVAVITPTLAVRLRGRRRWSSRCREVGAIERVEHLDPESAVRRPELLALRQYEIHVARPETGVRCGRGCRARRLAGNAKHSVLM